MVKRVIIYRVDEEGMSLDCEICGLDGCELERERERYDAYQYMVNL